MTPEQIYAQYKDVPLSFNNYHKYEFAYETTLDNGYQIYLTEGGDSGDIYRMEVSHNTVTTLADADILYAHIRDASGNIVWSSNEN